jgi:hypothetical protein
MKLWLGAAHLGISERVSGGVQTPGIAAIKMHAACQLIAQALVHEYLEYRMAHRQIVKVEFGGGGVTCCPGCFLDLTPLHELLTAQGSGLQLWKLGMGAGLLVGGHIMPVKCGLLANGFHRQQHNLPMTGLT